MLNVHIFSLPDLFYLAHKLVDLYPNKAVSIYFLNMCESIDFYHLDIHECLLSDLYHKKQNIRFQQFDSNFESVLML